MADKQQATQGQLTAFSKHYCRTCKVDYLTFDRLLQHKISSDKHICCYICSADFRDIDALADHLKRLHPHAQRLSCQKCGHTFNTLGGFTHHLETGQCGSAEEFRAGVEEKSARLDEMRLARGHRGNREGRGQAEEPLPALKAFGSARDAKYPPTTMMKGVKNERTSGSFASFEYAKINTGEKYDFTTKPHAKISSLKPPSFERKATLITPSPLLPPHLRASSDQRNASPSNIPFKATTASEKALDLTEDDLLLSYDAPSRILSAKWEEEPMEVTTSTTQPVPFLERLSSLRLSLEGNLGRELKTSGEVDTAQQQPPTDPDHPKFNASSFWIEFNQYFLCPHRGCKKSMKTEQAFITHLRSGAHTNQRRQCPACFKYFGDATGLAQHLAAQGLCRIRETNEFNAAVECATNGRMTTAGTFKDGSYRYKPNEGW